MENKYEILTEIIELCLSIDILSCTTYNKFAKECKSPVLTKEWKARTAEERTHIRFWRQALILSRKKQLPLIFENHIKTRNKLVKIKKTIAQIVLGFNSYGIPSEELSLASLFEIYMLDPAFTTMFQDYSFIDKSIEENYGKHILEFISMTKKFHGKMKSLHTELINETLHELYVSNKNLLTSSYHDSLTGIYNRRGFFNNINPILSLAERKKLDVGILMIDFDNFKNINDSLGHQAGDKALKEATSIINSSIRGSCISGRYGGDEFIILCDIENVESLEIICERIRKNIDEKSEKKSGIHFTVSLGAATGKINSQHEASIATIIKKADDNLFKAKKNGRNNWIV